MSWLKDVAEDFVDTTVGAVDNFVDSTAGLLEGDLTFNNAAGFLSYGFLGQNPDYASVPAGVDPANILNQQRASAFDTIKNDDTLDDISKQEFLGMLDSEQFLANPMGVLRYVDEEYGKAREKEGIYGVRGFLEQRRLAVADQPGANQLLNPGQNTTPSNPDDYRNAVNNKSPMATAVREVQTNNQDRSGQKVSENIGLSRSGRGLYQQKTKPKKDDMSGPLDSTGSVL